jgi:hypothetical protein
MNDPRIAGFNGFHNECKQLPDYNSYVDVIQRGLKMGLCTSRVGTTLHESTPLFFSMR